MRDRRRTPVSGVQAEKQLRYVRLIAAGVNNSEACRLVRINRKTGNRWRYGRSVRNTVGELVHYPPVKITPPKPRSPRYLSEPERIVIADLLGRGARSVGSPWSWSARHRRSAGRSSATAARMADIVPITLSMLPGPRAEAAEAADRWATACCVTSSRNC